MTDFRFIPITPHPVLIPYIARISVFECSGWFAPEERKLIVPNANFKLTFTYRNGIVADVGVNTFTQGENSLSLTGLIDLPVNLDPEKDTQTGTIIIEFKPLGAYRFFHLSYTEVKNQIVSLVDLIGNDAIELQEQDAEAKTVDLKLQLLQNFLIQRLEILLPDPIYDYCINRIWESKGLISVSKLEKETGYSSRWLHKKFLEHLGSGPKILTDIVRFAQFYRAYSTGAELKMLKQQIYQNYHDQSHFIKAFKRFTGSTPTDLRSTLNELSMKNFIS